MGGSRRAQKNLPQGEVVVTRERICARRRLVAARPTPGPSKPCTAAKIGKGVEGKDRCKPVSSSGSVPRITNHTPGERRMSAEVAAYVKISYKMLCIGPRCGVLPLGLPGGKGGVPRLAIPNPFRARKRRILPQETLYPQYRVKLLYFVVRSILSPTHWRLRRIARPWEGGRPARWGLCRVCRADGCHSFPARWHLNRAGTHR